MERVMSDTDATVILNTYRAKQGWLKDAVESYQNQTNAQADILISTVEGDPSLQTLRGSKNVRFCVSPEAGIYRQLNLALTMIDCPYFCYAADDDIALPHKLSSEIKLLKAHKTTKVVSSSYVKTNEALRLTTTFKCPKHYDLADHLERNFVTDCAMIETSLLDKYDQGISEHFDMSIGNFAHWDFWIRVALYGVSLGEELITFNDDPTWLYRQHSKAQHIVRSRDEEKKKRNQAERIRFLYKHKELLKSMSKTKLLTEVMQCTLSH